MGKVLPIGQILDAVTGNEPPKPPPTPAPVVAPAPTPVADEKSQPEESKKVNPNLGLGSTVLTSLRGLLDLNNFVPARKSLLGE